MARAIEEVDESKGHSTAVADFIDSEFSDNSGMMVRARRAAKGTWKKGRFTRACEKAGKIMEERLVPPSRQCASMSHPFKYKIGTLKRDYKCPWIIPTTLDCT